MAKLDKFSELRNEAEAVLKKASNYPTATQNIDFFTLLDELDTYRLELEQQNDDLRTTNNELQTVKKQLEDEIITHYQHYDAAPVGYVSLDPDWVIIELNQALLAILGTNKKEALKIRFNDFIIISDRDVFYRFYHNNNQKEETCQLRMVCKKGEVRWMELKRIPMPCFRQYPFYIAISDISHLKIAKDDVLLPENATHIVKKEGRDKHLFFSTEMQQKADELHFMQTVLDRAFELQQFELHYEPRVCITDNKIVGTEALLRWRHPERGLLSPADFFATAQETGKMIQLCNWVLKEACRQIAVWNRIEAIPLQTVAISIDHAQFSQKNFVANVAYEIRQNSINPHQLELEVSESALIHDLQDTEQKLMDLKSQGLGVRLAIDNFGVGYSSLKHLNRWPIDTIKIDQSFVKNIDNSDEVIVLTIISLAKALGLKLIAVGVENDQQLNYLTQHKCDMYQGSIFSEALPDTAFLQKIRHD